MDSSAVGSADNFNFTTAQTNKIHSLQRENESLKRELAQMRLALIQMTAPVQTQSDSTSGIDVRHAKSAFKGRTRKEKVKVAFQIMSVRHGLERLRNTVTEIQSSVTSDYGDALKMLSEKKKSVDDRIGKERPMVHRIHEAICELVRHGGNQKADTLSHLFSATSWGHTRMSLTQAAGDIVGELHNLVAVAEQQRRAKEVLEVAAIHKDRCLDRANQTVIEMAKTSRDVVGTFASLARAVHSMAAATEEVSKVRSALVTRALTLPDLNIMISACRKGSEQSTKAIEKFSRHLQDAAFAATSLLSTATKAVLDPETLKIPPHVQKQKHKKKKKNKKKSEQQEETASFEDDEEEEEDESDTDNPDESAVEKRRKMLREEARRKEEEERKERENLTGDSTPGLAKYLRKRWVKSVFERAMLRIKFRKCLELIHDDFSLTCEPIIVNATTKKEKEVELEDINDNKSRKPPPAAFVQTSPDLHPADREKLIFQQKWSSSSTSGGGGKDTTTTTNPACTVATGNFVKSSYDTSSYSGKLPSKKKTTTMRGGGDELQQQQQQISTTSTIPAWSSEDDRRLQLFTKRHKVRLESLGMNSSNAASLSGIATGLNLQSSSSENNNNQQAASTAGQIIYSGSEQTDKQQQQKRHTPKAPPHFLKQTTILSRRSLPPGHGSANSLATTTSTSTTEIPNAKILGRMSPITGQVEIANNNNIISSNTARSTSSTSHTQQHAQLPLDIAFSLRSAAPKLFHPVSLPRNGLQRRTVLVNNELNNNNSNRKDVLSNVTVKSSLREFFMLQDA